MPPAAMTASEAFGFSLLTFGLAAVRPAAVFLLLPAFSPEVVPAQVRNSIFLALGVVALVVAPPQAGALQPSIGFFLKEALIGASIGLFFAVFLYAMEVAGQIVDNVSGRSFATVVDPLGGHQTSLTGTLLGRLSQFVFMFGGGLTLLVGALIQSYAVWPMDAALPSLRAAGAGLFAGQFQSLMTTAVLFAGPVLVVLFAVDLSLGLVNRFAQQLNVFSLSMSIKAWLSVLVVMMLVPMVAEGTVAAFTEVADQVLLMLAALG